jgi:DNA mismatch endonuclease (patch repair protein)
LIFSREILRLPFSPLSTGWNSREIRRSRPRKVIRSRRYIYFTARVKRAGKQAPRLNTLIRGLSPGFGHCEQHTQGIEFGGRSRDLRVTGKAPTFERSRIMAAIRSNGNKSTELRLVAILRAYSITGWRRRYPLVGRPDFVFPRERLAIFVDGCFWHRCPWHWRVPRTNLDYWHPKFERNRSRDRRNSLDLRRRGWSVLRLWEHQLTDEARVAQRVASMLE